MAKVAVLTTAYNEPDFLPIWRAHYAVQVGEAHCYVCDHGTDDGSTTGLGAVNIVRIPRSAQDDDRRARFVSNFCSALLAWYDAVVYSDADELVFADPALYPNLAVYADSCQLEAVAGYGFNVVHTREDAPLDPNRPILAQRRWMDFSAAFCKPSFIRRPTVWSGGFHRADTPRVFDQIYMLHIRFIDRGIGLRRLARSRAQPWNTPEAAPWHRHSDAEHLKLFDRYDNRLRNPAIAVTAANPALRHAVAYTLGASAGRQGAPDTYDMHYEVDQLWPIPARFAALV